ncbi:MAG: pyrroline-5-carboxylate reductase [Candidatus Omnitrophica bacterium]|nr:pyrroline-5-carboxylate reductase [Candidatus Omnitrophota bacterium]MDD5660968.1 pyrroline-5-carboxylate reductase [Candidatus Omnitrophota bacterium]
MKNVGIIGYGNMGCAIAERIKDKYAVCVFDNDKDKTAALEDVVVAEDIPGLIKQSEVVILAVKPQDFDSLLGEIKDYLQDKVVITIAAGVTTKYMKNRLGEKARIVRVMPNMPAQIGKGVSVICKGQSSNDSGPDLAWHLAHDIFSNLGSVLVVDKEEMVNAATAVSGSGPAFFCYQIKDKKNAASKRNEFIKLLTESAASLGFDWKEAEFLSEKTVDGIIAMLIERNLSCVDIIKMVASKGGTTQAGLEVLNSGGSLEEAVKSAYKRADELGQRS